MKSTLFGRTFESTLGRGWSAWLVGSLCVAAGVLFLSLPQTRAQEKIPSLEIVPASLGANYTARRHALQQQLAALQAAAAAFNAKKPESQTDAEYDAVQAMRTRYIEAAKAFNQALLAEIDPMVVDARNVPSGLPKSVDNAIPHTPAGERMRKGFEALQLGDWTVALAWFQDALSKDPGDPDLQRLIDLAQFTLVYRTQITLPANGTGSDSNRAAPWRGQTAVSDSSASLAINSANSAAARARAEVAFEQYVAKYGDGHLREREAAVLKAERGEGFTKEELKEQLRQALKDYHRRHDDGRDAPTGVSSGSADVVIGGKG